MHRAIFIPCSPFHLLTNISVINAYVIFLALPKRIMGNVVLSHKLDAINSLGIKMLFCFLDIIDNNHYY